MADNLDFTTARAATSQMKPVGNEEVNALWARKVVDSYGRSIGGWGTVVATTYNAAAPHTATAQVDFSSFGFVQVPSLDIYQYRGGSICAILGLQSSITTEPAQQIFFNMAGGSFHLTVFGDIWNGTLTNFFTYNPGGAGNLWRQHFGTFIYRLRGW